MRMVGRFFSLTKLIKFLNFTRISKRNLLKINSLRNSKGWILKKYTYGELFGLMVYGGLLLVRLKGILLVLIDF